MNDTAGGPAGLMVLHVWTESGHRMRARLTSTDNLASGVPVTTYAATTPEVLRIVEQWLHELTAHGSAAGSPVTPP